MNIIFLDIDSILNEEEIDKEKVEELKKLTIDTDSKIVLSSSWRDYSSIEEERKGIGSHKLLEVLGYIKKEYDLSIYDVTQRGMYTKNIYDEADRWLENKNIENYIVFDKEYRSNVKRLIH